MSDTKKLLRMGSDAPKCGKCRTGDFRQLCKVRNAKGGTITLCRNCRGKRKPLAPRAVARKAQQCAAAGYERAACVVCEEPRLELLELDHLSGAANSDRMQPLCASHHAVKSYMAEHGPMAALRLRDPERSALLLQAAFEFGLGAMLGMFAAWDGVHGETARCIFLGTASVLLFAWAAWNVSADSYFEGVLGAGYGRAITAPVPR